MTAMLLAQEQLLQFTAFVQAAANQSWTQACILMKYKMLEEKSFFLTYAAVRLPET